MAEEFYERALKADPEDPIIRINYAMCLACGNIFDKATQMIETASKLEMGKDEKETYEKARELINEKDLLQIRKVMV